ncbi:MAG: HAMP domain-containing protein [Proteobacteria bacterium]|nr:HAMP domain-containing protein [Pseudomonadota bacterium]
MTTGLENEEKYEYLIKKDKQKKRRIWFVIFVCLCLLPILTFLETRFFNLGTVPFPVSGNVLVFLIININIILLLLMVFLVLRNLVQMVFERRRKFLGTKLRAKLVISFVSLSLIPTGLLFFIALQFVSTSMDYWFNINVEQSLIESLGIAKSVYRDYQEQVARQAKSIAFRLESQADGQIDDETLGMFLVDTLESAGLVGLEIVTDQRAVIYRSIRKDFEGKVHPEVPAELLRKTMSGQGGQVSIQPFAGGELVRGLTTVRLGEDSDAHTYVLVASMFISGSRLEQMTVISKGLEGYRQLKMLKTPIKTSLLVILLIVTLLIIFCAVWFGIYVARGLTVPIGKLAEGTRRVADGELDFIIEKTSADEMGTLVDSFNQMTGDLFRSKQELEKANVALLGSNLELDKRRRYMETILENVAAGVVSIDEDGKITTINNFAEDLLKIDKEKIIGHDYRTVLHPNHLAVLEGFMMDLQNSGKTFIQRPVRLTIRNEALSLRVYFTRLSDEEGNPLGAVLVFDNLTELEKAQRMAAWREVARRIAHEVKNPLTPIQLSAQRLRKKYMSKFESDNEVFDLCTKTIINQVDELKRLVSEFSSFARMPAIQKTVNNMYEMVREVLALYVAAHKKITFSLINGKGLPDFSFDLKQMKRVLINLLDNAVAALPNGGTIEIRLILDREHNMAILEVSDNGIGIKDEDKTRLFEPYFSTKKTGTGLGLAIASTVVSDHGGYIRVKDNAPQGAKFIIELPVG